MKTLSMLRTAGGMAWRRLNDPWRAFCAIGGVLLLLLVLVLAFLHRERPRPATPTHPDTATAAVWRMRALAAEKAYQVAAGDAEGWRGKAATLEDRIRGIEALPVRDSVVYDTTFVPSDPVILSLATDSRGELVQDRAIPVDSGRFRPATTAAVDLSNCDDGFSVSASGVVCDRARLGHLSILLRAGAAWPLAALEDPLELPGLNAGAALRWTPAFRSTAALELGVGADRRLRFEVEKGLRLF